MVQAIKNSPETTKNINGTKFTYFTYLSRDFQNIEINLW